jgi:hypothetical protein
MAAGRCFGGSTGPRVSGSVEARATNKITQPVRADQHQIKAPPRDQPDICRIFLAPAELAGVSQRPAIWPQRIACLEPTCPVLVECTRDKSVQHNKGDCS